MKKYKEKENKRQKKEKKLMLTGLVAEIGFEPMTFGL